MARTKKKRKYVRKQDRLEAANRQIENLNERIHKEVLKQEQIIKVSNDIAVANEKEMAKAADKIKSLEVQLETANKAADSAIINLRQLQNALYNHQRTLDLNTQAAANLALQNQNFLGVMIDNRVFENRKSVNMTDLIEVRVKQTV